MAAKASRVVVVAANMVLSSLPLSIDVDSYLGGEESVVFMILGYCLNIHDIQTLYSVVPSPYRVCTDRTGLSDSRSTSPTFLNSKLSVETSWTEIQ